MKKEVWLINHYAVGPNVSASTRHFDLGNELKKNGFIVKILASDYDIYTKKNKMKNRELYREEKIDRIGFVWVKTAPYFHNNWRRLWNMLTFGINIYRTGKKTKSKPEIIIGSSPHLFAALGSYFLAKRLGAEFLLEIRDLWPLFLIELSGKSKFHPMMLVFRIIEKFLYKKAKKIIILAPGNKNYLTKEKVNENKIIFIPNGVHFDFFQTNLNKKEAREKFGFTKFSVVYAGAHGPANSLETVIRAAERLGDNGEIEFVLVGDGVFKKKLKKMAFEKKLKNLRFLDPIPRSEIPDLLKAADAGLITLKNVPSFTFGVSPNKFFDYMAAKLPIVSAVGGEISKIVEENGIGYSVPPENDKKLAEAVFKLSCNREEERKQMGEKGYKLAEEKFSRKKIGEKLAGILESF